jgi:glycosyltransferase involved in cell wall biosynthesis
LSEFLPINKLVVSSNVTFFKPKLARQDSRKIIFLGKIETRKKQFELFRLLENSEIEVDFYGPIADARVINEIGNNLEMSNRFKGPINRSELGEILGNYGYLILPSSGEADALVLYEAQMAGLELIVEENAIGAQDKNLKWIHAISNEPTLAEIKKIVNGSRTPPSEIKEFAEKNYSWIMRNSTLVSLLVNSLNGN